MQSTSSASPHALQSSSTKSDQSIKTNPTAKPGKASSEYLTNMKFTITTILTCSTLVLASPLPISTYQLFARYSSQSDLLPASVAKNSTATTYTIVADPGNADGLAISTNGDGYIYLSIPDDNETTGLFVGDPGVGTGRVVPLGATPGKAGDGGWRISDDGQVTHTLSTPDDQFYSCEQYFDDGLFHGVLNFGSPQENYQPPTGCSAIQLLAVETSSTQ